MNVEQCMTRNPKTCSEWDSLESAARIMWENDCGAVPVVDSSSRLVGIITDRDTCMAAYTQGAPLHAIRLSSAMAKQVFSCAPKDSVETVERTMAKHRVRRMPVVDSQRRVVGILSIGDLARIAVKGAERTAIGATLASISEPHKAAGANRLLAAQPGISPKRRAQAKAGAARSKARAVKKGR